MRGAGSEPGGSIVKYVSRASDGSRNLLNHRYFAQIRIMSCELDRPIAGGSFRDSAFRLSLRVHRVSEDEAIGYALRAPPREEN